ncbi:hypothetical protein DFS34DRAFT_292596 [Phlyctochytrium arcticum]|nr:hypothetical protein DFS34DRAFT_292596 [Phlyctochytrium arcticum]
MLKPHIFAAIFCLLPLGKACLIPHRSCTHSWDGERLLSSGMLEQSAIIYRGSVFLSASAEVIAVHFSRCASCALHKSLGTLGMRSSRGSCATGRQVMS